MITKCLVDSNVIIAANFASDSLHEAAVKLLENVAKNKKVLNVFLISEIATVLLQKTKEKNLVAQLINAIIKSESKEILVAPYSDTFFTITLQLFTNQSSHKLSFADCSIIAQARMQKVKTILSFDRDLRSEFRKEFEFLPKRLPRN